MASVRINAHRQPNPQEVARKFLLDNLSAARRVFWDKLGHGMSLCCGREWEVEAQRNVEKFAEIKNELDLEELFRHYEMDE